MNWREKENLIKQINSKIFVRTKSTFGKICACMVGQVAFRNRHTVNLALQTFLLKISTCVWETGKDVEYLE